MCLAIVASVTFEPGASGGASGSGAGAFCAARLRAVAWVNFRATCLAPQLGEGEAGAGRGNSQRRVVTDDLLARQTGRRGIPPGHEAARRGARAP